MLNSLHGFSRASSTSLWGWKKVPNLWKTSFVIWLPKGASPSTFNDYTPLSLTSHAMKRFASAAPEGPGVRLNPLQFGYLAHTEVEDGIVFSMHRAYAYVERLRCESHVFWLLKTIQPYLLSAKLQEMQVNTDFVRWITDYLTGRLVCLLRWLCIWGGDEQQRCTSRGCTGTIPVLRLPLQLRNLPPHLTESFVEWCSNTCSKQHQ